jgi:Flp pilus assembly protein TadG
MGTRPATHHRGPDAGSATVELAAAIPLLVVVTLAMVGVVGLARDQVLAQGAAREAAREAAMGGDPTRTMAAARAALPPGRASRVTVAAAGPDRVRVSVQLPVRLPFGVQPVVVSATAVAAVEPGPAPSSPADVEPGPAPPASSDVEPGPGPSSPSDP